MLKLRCDETKRPRPAAIRHAASASDQIESVGQRVVLAVGRIFHVVNQGGNRKLEFERADLGDLGSRIERLRLFEQDPVTFVRFDLPFVNRVGLADVDDEELDSVSEAAMEFLKVPSLGTERRSGVAAEDQRYRLSPAKGRKLHLFRAAEARQVEVGRVLTDCRRQSFPLCDELHQRSAPLRRH